MRTTAMQPAHLIHEVEHNRNDYFQVNLPKKSGIGTQLHCGPHRTLLVLVDSSKAFDSMDHRVLSRLLANIPGAKRQRWLRNFLCGCYARHEWPINSVIDVPSCDEFLRDPYWDRISSPSTHTRSSRC
ncbi:telomerase reverse transcriptase/ribonuclease HI [Trypanosoma cruzi]|nr:telomerase reverse transcriptase/ribonuclease HI [Trypanosoma cruzi]